ncbi:MAG: uracil-DNA glycosylase [Paracoccaceae bacterium]|jgi:uracil-DNA glycosylase|nr:uracil-DNA glycosylase [Paracoccaceae bacterium]
MDSQIDHWTARALLDWQVELGVVDTTAENPINRYDLEAKPAKPKAAEAPAQLVARVPEIDPVSVAKTAVANVDSLEGLKTALAAFDHCDLKRGANNLVFSDGSPTARIMVIGEAPGREEDLQGVPFVGRDGQLLDKMFASIAMARSADGVAGIYLTNVLPWRPPQNRDPKPEEIAMMRPFVEKHIALAKPEVVVLMGNIAGQAMLGQRGISRLRGKWQEVGGVTALPMFHPNYLAKNSHAKREAWADLLMLQARLRESC